MKVSTLMGFVTFLVVGISFSASTSPADRHSWMQQCTEETGFQPGPKNHTEAQPVVTDREEWCFWACYVKKEGLIKDGKLIEREKACDILKDLADGLRIEVKYGKTLRQLDEGCYDEAKLKTEVCEIAGTLLNCLRQGTTNLEIV